MPEAIPFPYVYVHIEKICRTAAWSDGNVTFLPKGQERSLDGLGKISCKHTQGKNDVDFNADGTSYGKNKLHSIFI